MHRKRIRHPEKLDALAPNTKTYVVRISSKRSGFRGLQPNPMRSPETHASRSEEKKTSPESSVEAVRSGKADAIDNRDQGQDQEDLEPTARTLIFSPSRAVIRPFWMRVLENQNDVIGNIQAIHKIKSWLSCRFGDCSTPDFKGGAGGRGVGLVVVAPPGVGSTSIIRICARAVDADVSPIHLATFRTLRDATSAATKEAQSGFSHKFMSLSGGGSSSSSRKKKRVVVVLDHADAIFSTADSSDSISPDSTFSDSARGDADGVSFQRWATQKNARRQSPIVVVVSNTNSKALRSLVASPGWDRIHLYPLTVSMTALASQRMCKSLSYEQTQAVGRACAGDARQVAYRVAFPQQRAAAACSTFVCQQLSGNMFQACSFLLSDGRSVGRTTGSSSRERLIAMTSNPKVGDFTQANYTRMLSESRSPLQALSSIADVNRAFSALDVNGGSRSCRRLCAEMVAEFSALDIKSGAGNFFPEYHEREMHRETLEPLDSTHLLDAEEGDEGGVLTFRRRSRAEIMDYGDVHWKAVRKFYSQVSARDTRTLTCEQKRASERMLEVLDKNAPSFGV